MGPQPAQPTYQQPPPQQPKQPMHQMQGGGGGGGGNGLGGYYVNNSPNYNYQKRVHFPKYEKKVTACVEAESILKEAVACLRFEDVDTCIKKAEEAIQILRPHNH